MKAKTAPQANSLKEHADNKQEEILQSGKPANGLGVALDRMCTTLGPSANLPPTGFKPADFVPVREHLLNSGLAPATIEVLAGRLRQFLSELVPHGLDPACIAVFRDRRFTTIPLHPVEPAQRSHLKVILDRLQSQLELLQLLIWILLSGATPLLDAVLLEFSDIDWNTSLIRLSRRKSGMPMAFAALAPLMELLKERRKRLGPNAVYVFPELIFTQAELRDPSCNGTRLNGDSQTAARRAAEKARKLLADFVVACGLPPTSANYKSVRAHMTSFWASILTRRATMARVTGCMSECDGPFHVPVDAEIQRLRDITWNYLQAIRNDQPCFLPTSYYDIYEALMAELRKIQGEIAKVK